MRTILGQEETDIPNHIQYQFDLESFLIIKYNINMDEVLVELKEFIDTIDETDNRWRVKAIFHHYFRFLEYKKIIRPLTQSEERRYLEHLNYVKNNPLK